MRLHRILTTAVWAVATVGLVSTAANGQPTFSMDFIGPTLGVPSPTGPFAGAPIAPDDILSSPFPLGLAPLGTPALGPMPPPRISLTGAGLGIVSVPPLLGRAEMDALSYGHDAIPAPFNAAAVPLAPGSWHFSVDSFAAGDGFPIAPNVTTEGAAGFGEAEADIYTDMGLPVGPLPPLAFAGSNTGVFDGNGLLPFGAPGYGLTEFPGPLAGDNLDAVDIDTTLADVTGAPVYFSLDSSFLDPAGSPANTGTALANGFVGGDVLVSLGGLIAPFAPAGILGLDILGPDTDDLDALAMADVDGDLVYTPGIDVLFFSVRRGSAVIGSPDSISGAPIEEGDILVDPTFGGLSPFPGIFIPAEWIGLATIRSGTAVVGANGMLMSDDLNALDVVPEPATVALLALGSLSLLRRRRRTMSGRR